eukprot:Rmarinus@m.5563
MKITSKFLQRFHLDRTHRLLTARSVQLIWEFFKALDVRGLESLDDIQFLAFMKTCTDLSESQAYRVFDMFDVDHSGSLEFDEFYLLVCMLIAIKDNEEKQFLYKHSRTCFELLDIDGSGAITIVEFQRFGFVFNISNRASQQIFREFDVDDSKELDYEEFRMFCLAAIDKQLEIEEEMRIKEEKRMQRRKRFRESKFRRIFDKVISIKTDSVTT